MHKIKQTKRKSSSHSKIKIHKNNILHSSPLRRRTLHEYLKKRIWIRFLKCFQNTWKIIKKDQKKFFFFFICLWSWKYDVIWENFIFLTDNRMWRYSFWCFALVVIYPKRIQKQFHLHGKDLWTCFRGKLWKLCFSKDFQGSFSFLETLQRT